MDKNLEAVHAEIEALRSSLLAAGWTEDADGIYPPADGDGGSLATEEEDAKYRRLKEAIRERWRLETADLRSAEQ
jgi:hypothetical protein